MMPEDSRASKCLSKIYMEQNSNKVVQLSHENMTIIWISVIFLHYKALTEGQRFLDEHQPPSMHSTIRNVVCHATADLADSSSSDTVGTRCTLRRRLDKRLKGLSSCVRRAEENSLEERVFRWQSTEMKDTMNSFELFAGATNSPSSLGITQRIRQRSSFLHFFYKIEKRPLPATHKEEGAALMSVRLQLHEKEKVALVSDGLHGVCKRKLGQPTHRAGNQYQLVCRQEEWLPTYL